MNHRAGAAVLNASVIPPSTNGHSSSEKPMKKIASQVMSCTMRMTAAWVASTRSLVR